MLGPWSPQPQPLPHWWQGASGRKYHFWIYPLRRIPTWIEHYSGNYIFARPRHYVADQREPFYIGEKGDTDRFDNHEKLGPALALGATELHVCLTARSRWERLDIETDLRTAYWTPLNFQPTRALPPANALCGIAPLGMEPAGGGFPGPAPVLHPRAAMGIHPGNLLVDPIQPQNSVRDLLGRPLGMQPASGGIPGPGSALHQRNSLLDLIEPNSLSGLLAPLPGARR